MGIKGRALGQPVHQLLGGPCRDRIAVYSWIGGDRPADVAEAAAEAISRGIRAVKMNGPEEMQIVDGYDKVERVVANVTAVRGIVAEVTLGA